ncbi:MAG: hypothetical protein J6B57_07765 [Oscillospiraceae bacterium]|nr:hypothetical protein [Oscillospiraceae bacterium]
MDKREYKELSELAANGGTKAFARLYETVYREMYYTAFYTLCVDADAVELVTASARDGMSAISKLRTEEAFRAFMLRNLCARIRTRLKESPVKPLPESDGFDILAEFAKLEDSERLVAGMYIAAKLQPADIALYTGINSTAVNKTLERVLSAFELD